MNDSKKRVVVGMSGGIDSSATCLMLLDQGYEVIGVTMRVWDGKNYPAYIEEAKALADRLGIEHYVADEREPFKKIVVKNFVDEYLRGRTPNPCVMCNPTFKFRILREWADRMNCDYIATGHYARIYHKEGDHYIITGDDYRKDQSYFLWRLGQDILSRCIFPLGLYTKQEVRQFLYVKGFREKARDSESMEVCFIEGDYRDFLREQAAGMDERIGRGWFVDSTGVKLGEHKGYPYYTVGQRKGLEIALGYPAYVLRINPEKNTVMLGTSDQLRAQYMLLEDYNLVNREEFLACPELTVRIRYRSRPIPCRAMILNDNQMLVEFLIETKAVTPGQSAVFYDGNRVLGGAFIASQRGINLIIEENKDNWI